MNLKRKQIQIVIEELRRVFPDFLNATIHNWEQTKCDPPDIYIEDVDIGIESITYIRGQDEEGISGDNIVRQYTRRERITLKSGEKYSTKSTIPIEVSADWLEDVSLPDGMVDKFAKALCDLVLRHIPEYVGETIVIECEDFAALEVARGIKLSSYLGSINVKRLEDESKSLWICPDEAGWVGVSAQELVPLVRSEEKKREQGWKKDCKEEWLIILAGGGNHIPFLGLPSKAVAQPLEPGCVISSFDRVYWFNLNNRHTQNPFVLLTHLPS